MPNEFARPARFPVKEKITTPEQLDALTEASLARGFDVAAPAKPAAPAPARINPRKLSVVLSGEDYERLQLLCLKRKEKLQSFCERELLAALAAAEAAAP